MLDCGGLSQSTQSSAVHVTCLVFSLANEASHGVSPGLPLGDDPVVRPACTLVVRNTSSIKILAINVVRDDCD